jgi:alkylation response protein AidB-like acyl-CoA dehydrogenase
MRFILTDDQVALRDGIKALCEGRFPMERVREGFTREMWSELAEAGVFSLPDLGFGLPEEAVVFEELGRGLGPGPLVWGALMHSPDEVVTGPTGGFIAHPVDPAHGRPVENPLDPLTPMHTTDSKAPPEYEVPGAILTAAYLVGMAGACTDAAVAYAKEREQFDTPIGRFQSIKHLLADCLVRTELARAAVHAAAVEPSPRSASGAKVLAGDAALQNARTSFQVHGGMGFTWEVDVHLYLKRAWILDRQFGTADGHAHALSA